MGGAHLTREKHRRVLRQVARFLIVRNFQLAHIVQLRTRHLKAYIGVRRDEGVSVATLMNEVAIIRGALRAFNKWAMVKDPNLSNRALGIGPRCRNGTNRPLTRGEAAAARLRAIRMGRDVFGVMLDLQVVLGLRANEVVCATRDELDQWHRQIAGSGIARVTRGTKGGRERTVHPVDCERALAVIDRAIACTHGKEGYLLVRANGTSVTGLRQARAMYSDWMHDAGIKPHAARYAYAVNRFRAYREAGLGARQAYCRTGEDLGHGPSRGRYVRQVYCRLLPDPDIVAS